MSTEVSALSSHIDVKVIGSLVVRVATRTMWC